MAEHAPYEARRYFLLALDPVHVGTGGQRLGRVDMSIVREPGTQLPKIPGTSLSGVIRSYAARLHGKPACSGQGQSEADGQTRRHCREDGCPVCYTFGYIRGQDGGQSGVVSIGDARLLAFPVRSTAGPVWVTSPSALAAPYDPVPGWLPDDLGDGMRLAEDLADREWLNLGWLMLPSRGLLTEREREALPAALPEEMRRRVVAVSDRLFGHIVNSNLEVRTSVSIDPFTGAASDKALFTYEAIPRASVLWLEVVQDNYRREPFTEVLNQCGPGGGLGEPLLSPWRCPLDVVRAGLALAEHLGVGGMGTRGFGRVRLLGEAEGGHNG